MQHAQTEGVIEAFDRGATRWDFIYTGDGGKVARIWDRLTRENVSWRFHATVAAIGDPANQTVLDVGCGSGHYCVALAGKGARVTGIDFAPAMIERAQQLADDHQVASRCSFITADVMDEPLTETFDAVIANGVFDYTPNPDIILRRLQGVTGGKLVATFPLLWAFRVPFRKLYRMAQGCYVRFYTPAEIRALCSAAGFEIHALVVHGPIALLIARPVRPHQPQSPHASAP